MPKQRLDLRVHALGLSESREQGRRLIMAGEVTVDGETVDRPSAQVSETAAIALKRKPRFVSRGGEKLDAALSAFGLEVAGWVCADLGASTGGFTDVLLQRGAARVYALDVGHGILDYRLRIDPRVVVMEKTNARYQPALADPVRLVTVDASFISLKLLLPVARGWLATDGDAGRGEVVALIKPQFEAGRKLVGKGGIVKDPAVHRQVLEDLLAWAAANGLPPAGLIRSPIKGAEGNVEFLVWLRPGQAVEFDTPAAIERVLAEDAESSQP
jgi:23S rRNA (cytidine1920-2'-O)/16S rRNA (cytidine1409-2'-O)-methyltransferase